MNRNLLLAIVVSIAAFGLFLLRSAEADDVYHNLSTTTPLVQDWSNADLLTVADSWSGVPYINGYSDNIAGDNPGVDPQTQLAPSSALTRVNPNKDNPNLLSSGGVAEFDRSPTTNFVVALQGQSSTHDFPNIDIRLNTTSCPAPSNVISVSYNLRDVDGSADNAVQPIALHYRVGNTGNYANIPAGYVPDATTGPNLATLVTPVSLTLPSAAQGQPQVHLRIMTSNAIGTDEWVGIDDINISCQATADTVAPSISYAPLGNTSSAASRLVMANISDAAGVADGSLLPRIYFRKNGGPYPSAQCSLNSGNAQNGTYGCVIDYSMIGGVSGGDSIQYFILAQDNAGNVASNPAGVAASNVNTVTTPPATPNAYTLQGPTAGEASISGQVTTSDGRGISKAFVTVSGASLGKPITTLTSPFGYFKISGLRAGEAYVVSIVSKRYVFEPSVRFVLLGEDAFEVNFVGEIR